MLAADGVEASSLQLALAPLRDAGAIVEILAPHGGELTTDDGGRLAVDKRIATMSSVLYDAVFVADGEASVQALLEDGEAIHYVAEAYRHAKPVGASVTASSSCGRPRCRRRGSPMRHPTASWPSRASSPGTSTPTVPTAAARSARSARRSGTPSPAVATSAGAWARSPPDPRPPSAALLSQCGVAQPVLGFATRKPAFAEQGSTG